MKKSAKLLGAVGIIAFSTGCLGAFTASADPFVATLPVTTIATQNGGYIFAVTNTTSETLHVDFTYGAYLFSAFQFSNPNLRTILPGATADYAYPAAPIGQPPLAGTTPATQGQFFIELSDLSGARDYQDTSSRFTDTWAAVVDGATYDSGTFEQLFSCIGFPSSGRGCGALDFLYPPSLNPGATILGGEALVSFPIFAPEPASIALFSTSLFGLGPALWRRRISARRVTAAG